MKEELQSVTWLEPTQMHFHPGDKVQVKALRGAVMKQSGTVDPGSWKANASGPAGESQKAEIFTSEQYATVQFQAGETGLYHLTVENEAGVLEGEQQRARLPLPVGHHVHGKGLAAGEGLEIVPGEFKQYSPGDTVYLQVLWMGSPLPGVEVKATYHLNEDSDYLYLQKTDGEGHLQFTFDNKGHWMFLVHYREGGTVYTCTYVIPGVR